MKKSKEDEWKNGNKETEEEEKVTKILLVVVAIHAIFILPFFVYYTPSGHRGVFFYYLTNKTSLDWHEFQRTTEGISKIPVTSETTLTFIIHGFSESSYRNWIKRLSQAILAREDGHNIVLVVDYWDFHRIEYYWMGYNAFFVSKQIVDVIDKLVIHNNLQLSRTHLIGFSLGGRMCGMVAAQLKTGKVGKITALDPTFPLVDSEDKFGALDFSDAEMVVVLRTSLIAYYSPLGHVDFFVNGGYVQPGCDAWWFPHLVQQLCSHYRVVVLAIEAEVDAGRAFPSCICPDYISFRNGSCTCQPTTHFDLTTFNSPGGQFYFITNADPPYTIPDSERCQLT